MPWRGLLWWSALLGNLLLGLLLLAMSGALLWKGSETRGDALIVLSFVPAPLLAVTALAVFRPSGDARRQAAIFD